MRRRVVVGRPKDTAEVKSLLKRTQGEAQKIAKGKTLNELDQAIKKAEEALCKAEETRKGVLASATEKAERLYQDRRTQADQLVHSARTRAKEFHASYEREEAVLLEMRREFGVDRQALAVQQEAVDEKSLRAEKLAKEVEQLRLRLHQVQEALNLREKEIEEREHSAAALRRAAEAEFQGLDPVREQIRLREEECLKREEMSQRKSAEAHAEMQRAQTVFRKAQELNNQSQDLRFQYDNAMKSLKQERQGVEMGKAALRASNQEQQKRYAELQAEEARLRRKGRAPGAGVSA